MRLNYYRFPESMTNRECFDAGGYGEYETYDERMYYRQIDVCSVTCAKSLLEKYGGHAWTEHIDRNGSVFEVTDIVLKGNNSRHKYNHHL